MKRSTPLRNAGFKRKAPKLTERGRRILDGTEPRITLDFEFDVALAPLVPPPAPRARMAVNLAAEQPRAEPKEVRFESEAWRRAVASLPCVLCGKVGETQAAHANRHGKGAMRKADDSLVAACCVACHHELDQGKTMTRDERRAELDRAIVLTVKALARAGRLSIVEA